MGNAREYKPGSRKKRFRETNAGEYTDERMAWVKTCLGQMVLMYYPDVETEKKEPGPTVTLLIPQYRARTITWDLTHLTGEEFDALKEFLTVALDTAEPIVRMRDKVAVDAFAAGDDSFSRGYRQLPQLVVRPRKERADSQGLRDGSEDVSDGDPDGGSEGDSSGGVRGAGGELADDESPEPESQDDEPQAD